MFLIRTVYVKYIENERFLVNEIFLNLNLKILKNFWNKKCSSSIEELKSKGSDFFNLKQLSYFDYTNDISVVIRNTVPNTNTQLKNVPNKNNLYKMYRKKIIFSKWTFSQMKHENFFFIPLQKMFVDGFYIKFQRFKSN